MKQLTVRGFDDELAEAIRQLARRDGTSLNQAALKLLRRGADLSDGQGDGSGDWCCTTDDIRRHIPGDLLPGPRAGASRLSAASVAGATSTPPQYTSPGTTTASQPTASHPDRSHSASRSRCARDAEVLPRSSTTGSRSTSHGRWDRRRSDGRSRWRTCTGSAARVTGARPDWTAGSRGSSPPARWTGEEPDGPGDSTAPGRACSSLLSG